MMYICSMGILILNTISIISAFIFGVGVLYIAMAHLLKLVDHNNHKQILWGFSLPDIVILIISAVIVLSGFTLYKPY